MNKNQKLTPMESFHAHMNVLKGEKILNERIIKALGNIADYSDKVKYCKGLLATKDLITQRNKSKKKKRKLVYDLQYCLANIDRLEIKGLFRKEKSSRESWQKSKGENWRVKNSIRVISTPM